MIRITPDPVLVDLGPVQIGWYGVGYVIALAVMLLLSQRELERRGIPSVHLWNAMLLVGAMALLGGRLYHVIDQWQLYRDNPLSIILPPYSGLGLYGGIAGAAAGILIYGRWKRLPLRLGLDAVIPGTLLAQGIARWGNFFNQELYGPPTDLPWGIAIDCAHRVLPQYACELLPFETTGFHPLFFYESALNILGGFIALYLSRRFLHRIQPGDLTAFWGIWYGLTRTGLETLREGWNWTVGGVPTAQLVGVTLAVIGAAWIAWNHRPGNPQFEYPEDIGQSKPDSRPGAPDSPADATEPATPSPNPSD